MSGDAHRTTAEFAISMQPCDGLLEGTGRFEFTKTWSGGLAGASTGVMLSAGDPGAGAAGYVALEVFDGTVDGRPGTFAFQQFGSMAAGEPTLTYAVVPGSGTGELAGITGTVELTVVAGEHRVTLSYRLPTD